MLSLDHLVISCERLDEGVTRVEELLGVALDAGGAHVRFGTHNRLLRLGEALYLEVIAVDPTAAAPAGARWFDLDGFSGAPRLTHWACRSDDLTTDLARLPHVGVPEMLTRGDFRWQMVVSETGRLPFDDLFPALLQWHSNHPAPRLSDQGCQLAELCVRHPRAGELAGLLPGMGVRFEEGPVALRATLKTPRGEVVL